MATKKTTETVVVTPSVLKHPRVTEKTAMQAEGRVYTFDVFPSANKVIVAKAIKTQYGVTPLAVRIINVKPTRVFVRGKQGVTSAIKKALVTLKKGDKIDLS